MLQLSLPFVSWECFHSKHLPTLFTVHFQLQLFLYEVYYAPCALIWFSLRIINVEIKKKKTCLLEICKFLKRNVHSNSSLIFFNFKKRRINSFLFEKQIYWEERERGRGLPSASLLAKWPQWPQLSWFTPGRQVLLSVSHMDTGTQELESFSSAFQAISHRAGSEMEQSGFIGC